MTWLLTGGAGYIGAHIAHDLTATGLDVVVLDDLSTGHRRRLHPETPLLVADVRDQGAVTDAIRRHRVDGVIHLAARKDVEESTVDPLRYYRDNLDGLRSVLAAAVDGGVRHFVYSSSAAVYGTPPGSGAVTETSPTRPENPYGRTKLVGEWMVADAAAASGIRYASLRYFNVAGAAEPRLGDVATVNLLPRLFSAVAGGRPATVYGGDHPTRDGSCVRDYVHVGDLADAHVRVARALAADEITGEVFNVGRGVGVTVLEMVAAVGAITGMPLPYEITARRPGDPPGVLGCTDAIASRLGWHARHDLTDIVASGWQAFLHTRSELSAVAPQEASCSTHRATPDVA